MDIDALSLVFIAMVILVGFYFKQIWISLGFAGVLLLVLIFSGRGKKAPAKGGAPGGVQVRPIIVQRKYVGPESIYPKSMKMRVKKGPFGSAWWEYGPEGVANLIGKGVKKFKDLIEE